MYVLTHRITSASVNLQYVESDPCL